MRQIDGHYFVRMYQVGANTAVIPVSGAEHLREAYRFMDKYHVRMTCRNSSRTHHYTTVYQAGVHMRTIRVIHPLFCEVCMQHETRVVHECGFHQVSLKFQI